MIMEVRRSVIIGEALRLVLPSWLAEPLRDQFAEFDPSLPRVVFDQLLQVLRFGCSDETIADAGCSATTIRSRCDEWICLDDAAAAPRGPARPGPRPAAARGAGRR